MSVSIHRLRPSNRANEAVETPLTDTEKAAMMGAAAVKLEELFDILKIDHRADHNTRGTPKRMARMYVEEIMGGRYSAPPAITDFDNVAGFDQLIVTGPIDVRSTCAHHMLPIYGDAYIGILPAASGRIIGLSKYDRIVNYFASRMQIQEELVHQIGQYIADKTNPAGLAVRISAVHMCKAHRGVRAGHASRMVTSAFFGAMSTDRERRDEFQRECLALET